jgi:hypothetical protein
MPLAQSGRGAARLARLHGVQEVAGSNPVAPTKNKTVNRTVLFFVYPLSHCKMPSSLCCQMNNPP